MEYTTYDTWFVASLLTYGIKYNRIDESDPKRKAFIYTENPDFEMAKALHFAGDLNIPSLFMKESYRQILDIVKR